MKLPENYHGNSKRTMWRREREELQPRQDKELVPERVDVIWKWKVCHGPKHCCRSKPHDRLKTPLPCVSTYAINMYRERVHGWEPLKNSQVPQNKTPIWHEESWRWEETRATALHLRRHGTHWHGHQMWPLSQYEFFLVVSHSPTPDPLFDATANRVLCPHSLMRQTYFP